jgi:hypothetical protein
MTTRANLEIENQELRSRIAELERCVGTIGHQVSTLLTRPVRVATPPPPADELRVQIYPPRQSAPIELPDDDQLRKLSAVVLRKFPQLAPDTSGRWAHENAAEFHRAFCASFRRISLLRRSDRFDTKRTVRWLCDETEEYWRVRGEPVDVRWPCFVAAAIAAGDVPYTLGGGPYVGLKLDDTGRAPLPAWKAVLEGRMREPSREPQ